MTREAAGRPAGRQQGYEASGKVPGSQRVTEASSQRPKRPRSSRGNEAQKPYPTSREKIKESGNVKACREAARIRSFREGASEPKGHKGTQRRSQGSQEATKLPRSQGAKEPCSQGAKAHLRSFSNSGASEPKGHRGKQPRSQGAQEATKPKLPVPHR